METNKRLLIIDDQILYLKSLEIALKREYEVLLANTRDEAISILGDSEVHLCLIDIRLDEDDEDNMEGLEILEWIQLNKPEICSFVMSAYSHFSYAENALNLGAKHFFKKPIDITSMKAIIREKS
jgi:DNA-binding NtrC family response regulator